MTPLPGLVIKTENYVPHQNRQIETYPFHNFSIVCDGVFISFRLAEQMRTGSRSRGYIFAWAEQRRTEIRSVFL